MPLVGGDERSELSFVPDPLSTETKMKNGILPRSIKTHCINTAEKVLLKQKKKHLRSQEVFIIKDLTDKTNMKGEKKPIN